MGNSVALVAASGTLTASGAIANSETVTIGGKVYTFETVLTDVDGNVALGADDAGSLSNLFAAINLSDDGESAVGAGFDYAASMTRNPSAGANALTATTIVCLAGVSGEMGNFVDTTETGTNLAWGSATLIGGTGSIVAWLDAELAENQINSDVILDLRSLTPIAD